MIADILAKLQGVHNHGSYWTAKCPAHDDKQASLSIREGDKGIVFKCHAGCKFSDIADALRLEPKDLFYEPLVKTPIRPAKATTPKPSPSTTPPVEVASYPYQDELGRVVYEVVRYEPKTFKQRKIVNGEKSWGMDGVRRVPYHLPEVIASDTVHVVEGEKDADNLVKLGYVATTSAGGASGWLDAYAEFFKDKHVIVWPDIDKAGEAYAEAVVASIAKTAKDIRVCRVTTGKDISDFISVHGETAKEKIEHLIDSATLLTKGVHVPVYTMQEASDLYKKFVMRAEKCSLNLKKFLPSLGEYRNLVPGELVVVMADTGHGKSAALQNIAESAAPLPTLYFSLELPLTMIFERQATLASGVAGWEIEGAYRRGDDSFSSVSKHISICEKSRLLPNEIETIINQTELKLGHRPAVVMVDYLGLIQGQGKRYERLSDAAEDLKRIAKDTNTIIFMAAQLKRREEDDEVYLHDGKDTGSIENSAGLVLGLWRDGADPTGKTMKIKVLKCTKGKAGLIITCDFDGRYMRIKERQISPTPKPKETLI